jgi:YesN/AraC family two-component response regulator
MIMQSFVMGLKQLVDAEPGMTTAGEAQNGNEVLELVRSTPLMSYCWT